MKLAADGDEKTIRKRIAMANNAVSEKVTIAYRCNLGFEKFHRELPLVVLR